MRVISLNLRATPNRSIAAITPLAELIAGQEPDVALLQECRKGWLEVICNASGLTGGRSQDVLAEMPGLPPDGCAVAVRAPLQIHRAAAVPAELFAPRAIEELAGADTPVRF